MASSIFPFLRATYYRWAQRWPEVDGEAAAAPALLAVGDLHVENFGTWRDAEGRLVWGVNDFDEVHHMPYTADLVRLAVSAGLATGEGHLAIKLGPACDAILTGYTAGLAAGGRALVLAERDRWLRLLASGRLRDPKRFWRGIDQLPEVTGRLPAGIRGHLRRSLPSGSANVRLARRRAGLGSLGRQRVVATAELDGGRIAREAKALLPSAWEWAHPESADGAVEYRTVVGRAVRDPDPMVWDDQRWLVRRLAPDCTRVELASLPARRDENRLLGAMGWETANVHLGSPKAIPAVRDDLASRPRGWLRASAAAMMADVVSDFRAWTAAVRT
jgi:hypothetical protein